MNKKVLDLLGSNEVDGVDTDCGVGIKDEVLLSFIFRVETLEGEKAMLTEDIKNIMAEAKIAGYHLPAFRELLRIRKLQRAGKFEELESATTLYRRNMGEV